MEPIHNNEPLTIFKVDSTLITLKKFFGMKVGQTLKEFKAEMDQLSLEEKAEMERDIKAFVHAA